jgi:hypothetical protein
MLSIFTWVKSLNFKHRLRVCNAYPSENGQHGFDIYRGVNEKLTPDETLTYKKCREFKVGLKAGDRIKFKVDDINAGVFSVSDLPNNDAVMLLVIYRHDEASTSVSFESHVFANLLNAQIAVIDTYKGNNVSKLRIEDHRSAKSSRAEELRYDSVVAVNPGKYDCVLSDKDNQDKSRAEFVALNRESYVILRVGVDSKNSQPYDQEIIVFPQSDEKLLLNNASSFGIALFILCALLYV